MQQSCTSIEESNQLAKLNQTIHELETTIQNNGWSLLGDSMPTYQPARVFYFETLNKILDCEYERDTRYRRIRIEMLNKF
jgi:hypothetical protein